MYVCMYVLEFFFILVAGAYIYGLDVCFIFQSTCQNTCMYCMYVNRREGRGRRFVNVFNKGVWNNFSEVVYYIRIIVSIHSCIQTYVHKTITTFQVFGPVPCYRAIFPVKSAKSNISDASFMTLLGSGGKVYRTSYILNENAGNVSGQNNSSTLSSSSSSSR
jgi:hypothetical protein